MFRELMLSLVIVGCGSGKHPEEKDRERSETPDVKIPGAPETETPKAESPAKQKPATDSADSQTDTLSVPVKVVLIKSGNPDLDARGAELGSLFESANAFLKQAGIVLNRNEVVEVEARNDSSIASWLASGQAGVSPEGQKELTAGLPVDQISSKGWTMFVLATMKATPGVYLPKSGAVVVGLKNPRGDLAPRILAHEFGHSLGLEHVTNDDYNLMAQKKQNVANEDMTRLSSAQIQEAREQAGLGVPKLRTGP